MTGPWQGLQRLRAALDAATEARSDVHIAESIIAGSDMSKWPITAIQIPIAEWEAIVAAIEGLEHANDSPFTDPQMEEIRGDRDKRPR